MPAPLIYGGIVVGSVLFTPSDSGDEGAIAKAVGFDHPLTYKQIHEGAGTPEMETAAENLKGKIGAHFGRALELLETANRDANASWQGQAAEQFGNSTKPMTSFLTNAQSTSHAAGESVDRQVNGFLTVRNSMPEPKKVDATDSLIEKGGAWLVGGETDLQQQEREATEAAQAAKQTYDTYDNTINTEVQNPPRFDPPPKPGGDQGQSSFDRSGAINSPMGVGSGGGPGAGGSGGGIGGVGGGSGFGPGGSNFPDTPSGSGSSWAPGGGSTMPAPAPSPIGTGGGAGAGAGAGGAGLGMMPGGMGAGGAGAGAGGRAGAGGMGSGGRAGAGAGAANQPGAGGRSGVGTPGGGMAGAGGAGAKGAGAGGRGGMGMGGGMGAGRGGQGGEDDEHEHPSWLEEQDDVWLNDMPRTAPPVFGE